MATPKKRMPWRPRKYDSAEAMQKDIDAYFATHEVYTMSGLALALGMDRKTLLNYENNMAFFPTVKKARERVEEYVETLMLTKPSAGVIFNAKNNFGWVDRTEIDADVSADVTISVELTD